MLLAFLDRKRITSVLRFVRGFHSPATFTLIGDCKPLRLREVLVAMTPAALVFNNVDDVQQLLICQFGSNFQKDGFGFSVA